MYGGKKNLKFLAILLKILFGALRITDCTPTQEKILVKLSSADITLTVLNATVNRDFTASLSTSMPVLGCTFQQKLLPDV